MEEVEQKLAEMLELIVWKLQQKEDSPRQKLGWLKTQLAIFGDYEAFLKRGGT